VPVFYQHLSGLDLNRYLNVDIFKKRGLALSQRSIVNVIVRGVCVFFDILLDISQRFSTTCNLVVIRKGLDISSPSRKYLSLQLSRFLSLELQVLV